MGAGGPDNEARNARFIGLVTCRRSISRVAIASWTRSQCTSAAGADGMNKEERSSLELPCCRAESSRVRGLRCVRPDDVMKEDRRGGPSLTMRRRTRFAYSSPCYFCSATALNVRESSRLYSRSKMRTVSEG